MTALRLFQVDAFSDRPFAGNPAAVCPLEAWPEDAWMQAVAAENNLSETAFFVAEGDAWRLRWFTPALEVDLCGHATLASAAVLMERLRPGLEEVRFLTRSGPLIVRRRGASYLLDLPARPAIPCEPHPALVPGLGAAPEAIWGARKYLAVYASWEEVAALRPDMRLLAQLDRDGVIATAPGRAEIDFVSRYFCPGGGVDEDPVTGSAHCTLTPYWSARLGKATLRARQISRRGGDLVCHDQGERVLLEGRCAFYLEGTLLV